MLGSLTWFRGDSVPGIGPRDGAPEGGHSDIQGFNPLRSFPKDPSFRIIRTVAYPGRFPKVSSGGWGTALGSIFQCFEFLPEKVLLACISLSHALQVSSVRGRGFPREASGSIFRSEDRRISDDAILLFRSGDRRREICVPPFPPQGFSSFPSEEGRKEIFCGSLNASFNASSEEDAKGEAFPGWDPGYVGTCVPYAEACGGPYPFKDPRRNPSRKARSSTTPKGGFGRVLRIGTGARSNVRPKRVS